MARDTFAKRDGWSGTYEQPPASSKASRDNATLSLLGGSCAILETQSPFSCAPGKRQQKKTKTFASRGTTATTTTKKQQKDTQTHTNVTTLHKRNEAWMRNTSDAGNGPPPKLEALWLSRGLRIKCAETMLCLLSGSALYPRRYALLYFFNPLDFFFLIFLFFL